MKKFSSVVELVKITGAEIIELSSLARISLDEGQRKNLDGTMLKQGDYLIAEVRLLIPVDA